MTLPLNNEWLLDHGLELRRLGRDNRANENEFPNHWSKANIIGRSTFSFEILRKHDDAVVASRNMVVRLQKIDGRPHKASAARGTSAESSMIAEHANIPASEIKPDRRLRNWLLLANLAAWLAIIIAIRLAFF